MKIKQKPISENIYEYLRWIDAKISKSKNPEHSKLLQKQKDYLINTLENILEPIQIEMNLKEYTDFIKLGYIQN